MKKEPELYDPRAVERRILTVRGQRVILDRDLAELYGVPTFRFNEGNWDRHNFVSRSRGLNCAAI